jgi:hypothetical protein
MRRGRQSLPLLALLFATSCTTYEYEEEVFLDISGSGRIRISGSKGILSSLHGIEDPTVDSLRAHFAGPGLEPVSTLQTWREGRAFLHLELRFESFPELCRSASFRERRCELSVSDEEQRLLLESPRPARAPGGDVDRAGELALRFHLPSSVRYHNSPTGVERGNILSWEREVGEYFEGEPFPTEVRYGLRSILAATVRIVLAAAALVAAFIALAIAWMVRKGRRQLESDAFEPPSTR